MTTSQKFDDVLFQILKLASLEAMRDQGIVRQIANIITAAETVVGCKIADHAMDANIMHEVQDAEHPKEDRGVSVELSTEKDGKQIFIRMSGRHGAAGLEKFDRVEIVIN